jgi:hypothetical protein
MDSDDKKILLAMSETGVMCPQSVAERSAMDRLTVSRYTAKDPNSSPPIYRLTVRGWAFVNARRGETGSK